MTSLKSWLICLDNSETDQHLLRYVEGLAKVIQPESIRFIHALEEPDLPPGILLEFPDLHAPSIQEKSRQLKHTIANYFSIEDDQLKVEEGNATSVVFSELRSSKPDLIVCGMKPRRGPGNLVKKLSRKASGSLLVIPHDTPAIFHRLMVPIDFSDHAHESMDTALNISRSNGETEILCQHVYKNAAWYLQETLYTASEVSQHLEQRKTLEGKLGEYSLHKLNEYLEGFDLHGEVKTKCSPFGQGQLLHDVILDEYEQYVPDLLIIGARGQSKAKIVLLGSVAEKLIYQEMGRPILMIRKKDDNKSLLDFLFKN